MGYQSSFLARFRLTARLISEITQHISELPPYFENIARYWLDVALSNKCRAVVLVERPYKTPIHPYLFSAMSYDPSKSGPTPTTEGLATMVCKEISLDPNRAEEWFRDSWKYSSMGVFLFNVCSSGSMDDINTFHERIVFSRYLSRLIAHYIQCGQQPISLFCVGLKSYYVGRAVASSLGALRKSVSVSYIESPGTVFRNPSDSASHDVTMQFEIDSQAAATKLGKFIQTLILEYPLHCASVMSDVDKELAGTVDSVVAFLRNYSNKLPSNDQLSATDLRDAIRNVTDNLEALSVAIVAASTRKMLEAPPTTHDQGKPAAYGRAKPPTRLTPGSGRVSVTGSAKSVSVNRMTRTTHVTFSDSDEEAPASTTAPVVNTVKSGATPSGGDEEGESSRSTHMSTPSTQQESAPIAPRPTGIVKTSFITFDSDESDGPTETTPRRGSTKGKEVAHTRASEDHSRTGVEEFRASREQDESVAELMDFHDMASGLLDLQADMYKVSTGEPASPSFIAVSNGLQSYIAGRGSTVSTFSATDEDVRSMIAIVKRLAS